MTFTKDLRQLESLDAVPVDKMVLETDAPFLTPAPLRGKVNEPKHLLRTAEFVAERRGVTLGQLEQSSSQVVESLFKLR
ncbi:TatD family hydrolase, partial [Candidatus Saccharibacteria bacterium]|nr:TatD family hydrolase [Candidatus Saccharibacteria bacterium]